MSILVHMSVRVQWSIRGQQLDRVLKSVKAFISGGVGTGGVLAASSVYLLSLLKMARLSVLGVLLSKVLWLVEEAVLGANVVLTASTKIIDVTGSSEVMFHQGRVPPRSVVIPGTRPKSFSSR